MYPVSTLAAQDMVTSKSRKKKKKRASTPNLVLPAAIRPSSSTSSGSEVVGVKKFIAQIDPTLYVVSNSVLPQTTKGSQEAKPRSYAADPAGAHLGAHLPVTQGVPSKTRVAAPRKKKKKKTKKAPPFHPSTRLATPIYLAPARVQVKRKNKAPAGSPISLITDTQNMSARIKLVSAFWLLPLGDSSERVLCYSEAMDILEGAAAVEELLSMSEVSAQKKHIQRQLEDIIARRDPAKMLVVDKLMAQFDCKEIPFRAIFAMLKVKVEHSYPGECLTRHPEDGAAPAPAAPETKKKKEMNAPAPPHPVPTKAETAKDTTKVQPANDDAGAEAKTSALDRFRKAGVETQSANDGVANSEDIGEKLFLAGVAAAEMYEEQADAAFNSGDIDTIEALRREHVEAELKALHRDHIQAQILDILSRRAPDNMSAVSTLMAMYDSPDIHYRAIFAMLKIKIEDSFPGEVLTDKLSTTKETEKLPDLSS